MVRRRPRKTDDARSTVARGQPTAELCERFDALPSYHRALVALDLAKSTPGGLLGLDPQDVMLEALGRYANKHDD